MASGVGASTGTGLRYLGAPGAGFLLSGVPPRPPRSPGGVSSWATTAAGSGAARGRLPPGDWALPLGAVYSDTSASPSSGGVPRHRRPKLLPPPGAFGLGLVNSQPQLVQNLRVAGRQPLAAGTGDGPLTGAALLLRTLDEHECYEGHQGQQCVHRGDSAEGEGCAAPQPGIAPLRPGQPARSRAQLGPKRRLVRQGVAHDDYPASRRTAEGTWRSRHRDPRVSNSHAINIHPPSRQGQR